jgi:hypothetical protein
MADQNIPTPDFVDISDGAQKAAAAALDQGAPFIVPPDAKKSVSKKAPFDEYNEWTEGAVIEAAWREGGGEDVNKINAVVQMKVRAGYPNEEKRTWARHTLNIRLLLGQGTAEDAAMKSAFPHNLAVSAITSLFAATGFTPKPKKDDKVSKGLKASLLNSVFPPKGPLNGTDSPLVGKVVLMNLKDAPNKSEKRKHDRRTNVESYLPDAPAA